MIHATTSPLLARLRRSPRFIVLMLLVFMLRVGADVACTAHDILDVPVGSTSSGMSLTTDGYDRGQPSESPFDISGACDHCGCHQVAAMLAVPFMAGGSADAAPLAERHASALPDLTTMELRPPIV